MLDLLLKAEKNNSINVDGIKEEVSTFIFAVNKKYVYIYQV